MTQGGRVYEWVEFDLPTGTTREEALKLYHGTAPTWAGNPDLIAKTYIFDADRGIGGGLYIWPNREAAARWHGEDYRRMVRDRYGSAPRISVTEALLHVSDGDVESV